ncbi:MAG: reverse transcriptase-like protein [Candidatus Eisenbacteria bacterium]|nr:reverse transcriptase-like protein [Candidatus Eisenbacteria bacterium]
MEFGSPSGGTAAAPYEELVLHTDGASLGNPGPAGAGGVLETPDGETVEEFHEHLGKATNNVAEYEAVRIGLGKARDYGARRVRVYMDSELVANQLRGRYKIKHPGLLDAYLRVEQLMRDFDEISFETIPREENGRADRLAQTGARRGRP